MHKSRYPEIARLIDVAQIYIEDGAPRTAARRLRMAADLLEEEASLKNALLKEAVLQKSAG